MLIQLLRQVIPLLTKWQPFRLKNEPSNLHHLVMSDLKNDTVVKQSGKKKRKGDRSRSADHSRTRSRSKSNSRERSRSRSRSRSRNRDKNKKKTDERDRDRSRSSERSNENEDDIMAPSVEERLAAERKRRGGNLPATVEANIRAGLDLQDSG